MNVVCALPRTPITVFYFVARYPKRPRQTRPSMTKGVLWAQNEQEALDRVAGQLPGIEHVEVMPITPGSFHVIASGN